jgi:hypothetical protein
MTSARTTLAAPGHNTVCMRTKMNRYDLRLWDVGKRSLYVEKRKASKLRRSPRIHGMDLNDSTSTKTE